MALDLKPGDEIICPSWSYIATAEAAAILGINIIFCDVDLDTFNEDKLLSKYKNINFYDHQGTHFAPHLVSKKMWDKVGGFSEEFNPGIGSDPDFNMKLWREGVRIFKGLNDFKVYHFGSLTTRKKKILFKIKEIKHF